MPPKSTTTKKSTRSTKKEHAGKDIFSSNPEDYWPQKMTVLEEELHRKFDDPFFKLVRSLVKINSQFKWPLVIKAYNFAVSAHQDILRKSGAPYFKHLFDVAKILTELHMDSTTIAAGLLHDTIEDTNYTFEDISNEFNVTIAELVNGVTKISEIKFNDQEVQQAENFRKMLLSMAKDIRVVIIKLADRLNNMRTLEHMPQKKRKRIATETLEVYAPLAHRLGMANIKTELEDLCLKYLDGKAMVEIVHLVNKKEKEREKLIEQVKAPILERLLENNIKVDLQGRAKHFYSIYHKMKGQNRSFDEIYDLLALRIIVEHKSECYAALGLVHSLFTPLADRFKDYIATPKNNGYRSLHTTIVALDQLVEIQIRTKAMHEQAEEGIAAHWNYKEGQTEAENDQYILWVREILQQRNEDSNPETFMDNLKSDLYQDEVFVYSPKGQLFKLPQDATALDFGFEIHSNLGLRTIGAKVNGHIVPLRQKLSNGEVVEIITTKNPVVNRDWLDIVTTSKARHATRKWLKDKEFDDSTVLGKEMLENVLKNSSIKINDEQLLELAGKLGYQDIKALYAAIGHDDINPKTIVNKFSPEHKKIPDYTTDQSLLNKFFTKVRKDVSLKIEGLDNLMITFAKCCQPVPGDKIVGYVTRGRGVTIHRLDCKNMIHLTDISPQEKVVTAEWSYKKSRNFPVQLIVRAIDRSGLLQDITGAISRINSTGLLMVNMRATDGLVTGHMMVDVSDLDHLNKVIKNISKIDKVISVERFSGQQYPL